MHLVSCFQVTKEGDRESLGWSDIKKLEGSHSDLEGKGKGKEKEMKGV
jgi:hypothetical protein